MYLTYKAVCLEDSDTESFLLVKESGLTAVWNGKPAKRRSSCLLTANHIHTAI
jgi:hypothetical protein